MCRRSIDNLPGLESAMESVGAPPCFVRPHRVARGSAAAQYTVRRPPDRDGVRSTWSSCRGTGGSRPPRSRSRASRSAFRHGHRSDQGPREADEGVGELRAVLRFARKHKLRFDYLREVRGREGSRARPIFNGILFPAGTSVARDEVEHLPVRVRVGLHLPRPRLLRGARRREVHGCRAHANEPVGLEYTQAKGRSRHRRGGPDLRDVERGKSPGSSWRSPAEWPDRRGEYEGEMYDVDIFATVNFVNNFGVLAATGGSTSTTPPISTRAT